MTQWIASREERDAANVSPTLQWVTEVSRRSGIHKRKCAGGKLSGPRILHLATLMATYSTGNTGKGACPSQESLAEFLGCDRKAVRYGLEVLEDEGWLLKVANPVPRERGAEYWLTIPVWLTDAPPFEDEEPEPVPATIGLGAAPVPDGYRTREQREADSAEYRPFWKA